MNKEQLVQLGNELREIGHRRRELAEKIFSEVQEDDNTSSRELYRELSNISEKAIELMTHQKEIFDNEINKT